MIAPSASIAIGNRQSSQPEASRTVAADGAPAANAQGLKAPPGGARNPFAALLKSLHGAADDGSAQPVSADDHHPSASETSGSAPATAVRGVAASTDPAGSAVPDPASLAAFAGWNMGARLPGGGNLAANVNATAAADANAACGTVTSAASASATNAGVATVASGASNVEAWLEALLRNGSELASATAANMATNTATNMDSPAISAGEGAGAADSAMPMTPSVGATVASGAGVFSLALPLLAASDAMSPGKAAEAPPPVQLHGADAPQQWSAQIEWTLKSGLQEARVEVSPDTLGPVQIHLQLIDSTLSLHLHAAQPETRTLLQEQLPALRQALAQSGISVGDAQVGQGQHRFDTPQPAPVARRAAGEDAHAGSDANAPITVRVLRRGLLDDYA